MGGEEADRPIGATNRPVEPDNRPVEMAERRGKAAERSVGATQQAVNVTEQRPGYPRASVALRRWMLSTGVGSTPCAIASQ